MIPNRGTMRQNRNSSPLKIARNLSALRRAVDGYRGNGETVALVPTMGALHEGHLSLIRLAKRRADRVVVSIFVNPTQFAPNEDLASYPRTFKADAAKLVAEGVDLIWNPNETVMYPPGFATRVSIEGPATAGLEDRFRPHFFGGVATVVCKLFIQVTPDLAIFGEKDYQQLKVVTQMAHDLDLRVRVIGAPTKRERDGLAMSSRNVYLDAEQRRTATTIYRAMTECAERLRNGGRVPAATKAGATALAKAGFEVDYFEARHAETLAPISSVNAGPIRLLVAARIGTTRLIDNMKV